MRIMHVSMLFLVSLLLGIIKTTIDALVPTIGANGVGVRQNIVNILVSAKEAHMPSLTFRVRQSR